MNCRRPARAFSWGIRLRSRLRGRSRNLRSHRFLISNRPTDHGRVEIQRRRFEPSVTRSKVSRRPSLKTHVRTCANRLIQWKPAGGSSKSEICDFSATRKSWQTNSSNFPCRIETRFHWMRLQRAAIDLVVEYSRNYRILIQQSKIKLISTVWAERIATWNVF